MPVKLELHIDPECGETAVTVTAPAMTEQVRRLMAQLEQAGAGLTIPALQGEQTLLLEPADVLRFYAEEKGVSAQTREGAFPVKLRLYELEEQLDGHTFVRISHSEIVNLKQITALDLSLAGTIKITLAGGTAVCWASRRYVKKIKQAIGL